jgi:hypothetical protein
MPGYFRSHGYQVYGSGKLFHPNLPPNNDVALSFTDYSDGEDLTNLTCNNGSPVMEKTMNESIGQGRVFSLENSHLS